MIDASLRRLQYFVRGYFVDPTPRRRKRASKGWRKHVRRVKAAERRGL